MFQKSKLDLAKESLVKSYGTRNCKILVRMPSSEAAFSALRNNIEREYSKYKDKLPDEQYHQFIEEIFEIFKEYKSNLEKAEEKYYGDIFGVCAMELAEIVCKYGL